MTEEPHILEDRVVIKQRGIVAFYRSAPLYLRILAALCIGLILGLAFGTATEPLKWVSRIVLRVLGALAPALILVAVIDSILNARVQGRGAAKMAFLWCSIRLLRSVLDWPWPT
jgi:Na+/serine symporter